MCLCFVCALDVSAYYVSAIQVPLCYSCMSLCSCLVCMFVRIVCGYVLYTCVVCACVHNSVFKNVMPELYRLLFGSMKQSSACLFRINYILLLDDMIGFRH